MSELLDRIKGDERVVITCAGALEHERLLRRDIIAAAVAAEVAAADAPFATAAAS